MYSVLTATLRILKRISGWILVYGAVCANMNTEPLYYLVNAFMFLCVSWKVYRHDIGSYSVLLYIFLNEFYFLF